jgi:RNA polymerase sigma factor (sigma-70 family)
MMTPKEPAELDTINAAIRTGGEQYWRVIYHAYFARLEAFIAKKFGPLPSDIAEDLAYRTLLKLVNARRRPQFADIRQFVAWLYKAARCSALDYWRSAAGKAERVTQRYEHPDDLIVDMPERVELNGTAVNGQVEAVLARLTTRDRILLTMRANGTAYSDIAQEIGVAENAARTYFSRAKSRFKKLYVELVGEAEP